MGSQDRSDNRLGARRRRDETRAAGLELFLREPYRPAEIFDCMALHWTGVTFAQKAIHSVAFPEGVREQLAHSLIALDAEGIAGPIRGISEVDPALGGVLRLHSDPACAACGNGKAGPSRRVNSRLHWNCQSVPLFAHQRTREYLWYGHS